MKLVLFLISVVFSLTDCSHAGIADPCAPGLERKRTLGATVVRRRQDVTKAFVFVQGPIGENRGTPDLFWPERIAEDRLFEARDVYVLTLGTRLPECNASEASITAIGAFVRNRLRQYRNIVMIANDIRNAHAIDQALSSEEHESVRRVLLFNTPAADRALHALPQKCGHRTTIFTQPSHRRERIVCSTFDRGRLADAPIAAAVCGSVLVAEMSPEMMGAAPCEDALYPIFRGGLASTAYESEQ
jgi:hypothetical protein